MVLMMATRVALLPILVLLLLAVLAVIVLIKVCSGRSLLVTVIVLGVLAFVAVFGLRFAVPHPHRQAATTELLAPGPKIFRSEEAAAIWQPGIEDQFEADIYPSKISAVRSLALRIDKPIRQLFGDLQWPRRGIVFEGGHDRALLEEFIKTAAGRFPHVQWTIAPETVAVQSDEFGVRLDLSIVQAGNAPWSGGESASEMTRGTFRASVMADRSRVSINAEFVEKPWIENFYGLWNDRPNMRLIVAKSAESCLAPEEARRQAIANACSQLTPLLRQTPQAQATPSLTRKVTANDVLERGFVLDQFSQKFEGRAGGIWRHALLIDASPEKMEQFAKHNVAVIGEMRKSWAKMIVSVAGMLALITLAYTFLNAATRGYYTWSLRIAGAVLAAVVIILFIV